MSLPEFSIRRPVATAMLFVGVAVLGAVSFTRLPVDLLPDVAFPTLSVATEYPDAGPAEVERYVTAPVEEQLSRVPGVREVTSRSREGLSLVRLEFAWGTDMEFAALHVRERLDNLRAGLPRSAERPAILRTDPSSDPVINLALTGGDLLRLRGLAETVFKRRLEQLDGVALAAVTGGPEREIHVTVEPDRLAAYGLSMEEVRRALDAANYSAPGGRIRRGRYRYTLRTLGEFASLEDIRRVSLRPAGDAGGGGRAAGQADGGRGGSPAAGAAPGSGAVRVADVARVEEGFAERRTLARYGGAPAVGLQLYKESGANTVRVDERVEAALERLRAEYPEVTVATASSQARFIRDAIAGVVQALLLGGVLAFLVLFLFLRDPRYPVAVGLAIPVSVLAAFGLFYLFDVSLNVMSLGGLALGVGMLVDNSIVVLENVFRHRREEGRGPDEAAAVGAREVAAAITASTLTTIAVFGPVLYVRGVAGALFEDLSLSVAFSLLASLLVALALLPGLTARLERRRARRRSGARPATGRAGGAGIGRPGEEGEGAGPAVGPSRPERGALGRLAAWWRRGRRLARRAGRASVRGLRGVGRALRLTLRDGGRLLGRAARRAFGPSLRAFDEAFERFAAGYERTLAAALDRRAEVAVAALISLVAAAGIGVLLPRSVMPRVDEGRFRIALELPVGTPLETTARAAERLEAALLDDGRVEAVFTRVGRARGAELAGGELAGPNTAALEVRVADGAPAPDVVDAFRRRAAGTGIPAAHLTAETGRATSLGRALAVTDADLAVEVRGEEMDAMFSAADSVRSRLAGSGELVDVRVDQERARPTVSVRVDRSAAARHGLSVREVADAIEAYLRGARTERPLTEFADRVGIEVRMPPERRDRLTDVLSLTVGDVPVRELVRVERGEGPVEVRRRGQTRTVRVLADVRGAGLAEAVGRTEARLAGLSLPEGVTVRVGGANEEMRESFRSLLFALGLALFLVYLILAAQFESLAQPLVILAAVPLSAVGAVAALWVTGSGINVLSGIGTIVLVGIVVNDAIIKVDFVNQHRRAGSPLREALMEAGRLRLRPIVMTTVTTVFGLLPMALGWGAGADLRAPLAVAVIGGLLSATLLTLIVVPVLYSLVAREGLR